MAHSSRTVTRLCNSIAPPRRGFSSARMVTLMALKSVPLLTDVEYWRARAEAARATAETFEDPRARACMEGIARSYDDLAALGQELLDGEKEKPKAPPRRR